MSGESDNFIGFGPVVLPTSASPWRNFPLQILHPLTGSLKVYIENMSRRRALEFARLSIDSGIYLEIRGASE